MRNGSIQRRLEIVGLVCVSLLLAACQASDQVEERSDEVVEDERELVLMTHDSFSISEHVLADFEAANDASVLLLPAGDAGAALNQAILAKDDPLADLFFGVDNTFMGRALDKDIFLPYESPRLDEVGDDFELDPSHRLTPIDYGDVCFNYDKAWFEDKDLQPPETLLQFTEEIYRGLLVVENPATSSPGLSFLLTTVAFFGEEGDYTYLDYWRDLKENEVLVTDGWEDAYFGQFSATGDGRRPIVVSYASSPPAEVIFADPPIDEPPTAAIVADDTCFRQVEFVGILKGTQQEDLAQAFVDFMLSETFQEDIPLNMFVFPVNEKSSLPEEFVQWAAIPDKPASISPDEIDSNREEWILSWTEVVLR